MRWSDIADGRVPENGGASHRTGASGIAELSIVRLGKPVATPRGIIPAGCSGTVVHAYGDGLAYLVEFYEPFHAVATVEADAFAA